MPTTKIIGDHGESLAVRHLQENGYNILERNYRYKRGEIDIVAEKDSLLVFVEVKTRTRIDYGQPEEGLTEKQEQRILEVADNYLEEKEWQQDIRFDVVAITLGNPPENIHFEDAFY